MIPVSRMVLLAVALMLFVGTGGVPAHGDDKEGETQKLERIKREMLEKKKELKRAKRKERSILSELDRIDRDIHAGSVELANQQKWLRDSEISLREIEQSNAEINQKLDGLKKIYAQRLRALYQMSRSGNDGFFSAESLDSALKRVTYLSMIAEQDRKVMKEYSDSLTRLSTRQTEIAEKKKEILSHQRSVEVKKAELVTRKRKKADLLAGVRKEKGLSEQTLRELEESSASLWAMIKKAELEKKDAEPTVQDAGALEAKGPKLPWPLEGQVLTRFGMQRHPQFGTMVFRRGIEIQARAGDAVRAVSDGQVAYADWYKGYGNLVILEHGNGLYTLYGNLSRLDAKKNERVPKGQVIGLAGDSGSMKGAKLYFEIRRNGEAQDPLLWLAKK